MLSTYLATVLGWYLVIFAVFLIVRQDFARAAIGEIASNRGVFLIMAIITMLLGLLLVAAHNVWPNDWTMVISVFAWLILISGLVRLFFPEVMMRAANNLLREPSRLYGMALIVLVLGLYLLSHVYHIL